LYRISKDIKGGRTAKDTVVFHLPEVEKFRTSGVISDHTRYRCAI
jgi:hypothetical protein